MSAEGDRLGYWGGIGRAAQGLGFADSDFLEFGIAREPCKSWDDGGWSNADVLVHRLIFLEGGAVSQPRKSWGQRWVGDSEFLVHRLRFLECEIVRKAT